MSATPRRSLPRRLVALLSFSCGLAVASIYYAQPLVETIAASFRLGEGSVGALITLTQVGYAAGLVLLVPLGDALAPRSLIAGHLAALALALAAVAAAPSVAVLLLALVGVGALAVVVQTIVAFAASQAADHDRGAVVGSITGGVVVGILLSRALAGALAEIGGWRAVYVTAAALALLTSVLLWRAIPAVPRAPTKLGYREILASLVTLYRDDRLLRQRAALALLVFGAFSTLWTALALPLSEPRWGLTTGEIGAFGVAGLAGAFAAGRAGRLADRGHAGLTTGAALTALVAAWVPLALLDFSLLWLVVGVIVLDAAVQAVHVTSQTLLYATRPEARSRLAAIYMLHYALGSAVGASASTAIYATAGWIAVCVLGAAFAVAALLAWTCAAPVPPACRVRASACSELETGRA